MTEGRWPKATKEHPCPKCGAVNRCTIAPDGYAGVCFRTDATESWHDPKPVNGNGHAHRPKQTRKSAARSFATREAAIEASLQNVRRDNVDAELTRVFEYQTVGGGLLFCVARFDWPGDKTFRPIHLHKSEWREGDPPGKLPLYRVNEIPKSGPIYIHEGEKASDTGWSISLPSVTSAHGASSAESSDWTPAAEHNGEIIIFPDNDDPGAKYARTVARLIFTLNPSAKIKIINLPGLPVAGDIVEFIAGGGTRDDIEALTKAAQPIDASEIIGGPVLVSIADVEAVEIKWLWQWHIPLGRISMLSGKPGEGKSFYTLDLAARVSTGSTMPDGTPCPRGSVILICAEDDGGDTIRPRLDACGADVSKIHLLTMVKRPAENGMSEMLFTLADVAALEMALKAIPDCKLIVIDPIGSYLGARTDSHRDNEVRAILSPVAALAAKYSVAVLIVAHTRKAISNAADDGVLGSRAFTGICRAVWHLSRDKDNRDRRLLLPGKNNLAKQPEGMAFTIGGDPPRISWERDPIRMHADDVIEQNATPGPAPEARKAAEEWLMDILANGPVLSGDLKNPEPDTIRAMAKEADFSWPTIRRAKDKLGIRVERDPYTKRCTWRLPKAGNQLAHSTCSPMSKKEEHEQLEQVQDQHGITDLKSDIPIQLAHQCSAREELDEYDIAEREAIEREGEGDA